jgi:hypothetical protein
MSDQSDNNGLLNFIVTTLEDMREQMVTKSDLEQMATKSDLEQMATKNDLVYLETRLVNKLEAEITAVRGDIEQVNLRLDSIERTLSARLSQIEAEVSRLRSVVYLLVKDKPEMLRLLGQPPS